MVGLNLKNVLSFASSDLGKQIFIHQKEKKKKKVRKDHMIPFEKIQTLLDSKSSNMDYQWFFRFTIAV
jgi:hypothetical protein